ncbi:MAG TPA: aa3-type cytochrome c oxidase subunit IV [Hyphomicrobiaceae bacterium]|nr:aa3-type cytochrome c oxidase subunit IV [Hyphomicrobiaceae bacterium]
MSVDTSNGHPAMDYAEHERTFRRFVRGTAYAIALVAIVLVLMAAFLT